MASISGGDKLKSALDKIAAKLRKPGTLRVGFLEGRTYPDGKSVPMIAAINEFGRPDKGQPPRPYFRNMIAAKSGEWPSAIAGLLKVNDYDTTKALDIAGFAISEQLQESIRQLTAPPLAASTIARKGFDKPLIETSVMLNSVGHEVKS